MNIRDSLIGLVLLLPYTPGCYAQQSGSADYYSGIRKFGLSKLWHTPKDKEAGDSEEIFVPEPLGFIGDQYERFYIHYLSIIKSTTNPYEYIVYGKTKVKDNICTFRGTIKIVKAGIYKKQFDYRYKQGFVECRVAFNEDSTQRSSGFFIGKLTSNFYLDEKSNIQYDDLLFGPDGYFNNQCEASWTSYQKKKMKRANWGDYRMAASKELDMGDGEFSVNKKYQSNGWYNYVVAWSNDPEKDATKKAQQTEASHWWE